MAVYTYEDHGRLLWTGRPNGRMLDLGSLSQEL